jgi:hypothetical protein
VNHDYARESKDDQYRMHCCCGKRSRWSVTTLPVMEAQDRHADEVALTK